jgi:hypothetical protein
MASPIKEAIGIDDFIVEGVAFPGGVKRGPVTTILRYVAEQFHRRVEPLHPGHCWGYNYREVRGGASISNHAAGCAIDINSPAHAMGRHGTFSPAQVEQIHAIVAECCGVVRWGGTFTRPDEMHFEVVGTPVEAVNVAAHLIINAAPAPAAKGGGDPVTHIPVKLEPDRTFRVAFAAECGAGSQIVERAWIVLGSTWGNTTMTVGAIDPGGKVLLYKEDVIVRNNHKVFFEIPSGGALATVEGTAQFNTTIPVVGLVSKPRP